MSRILKHKRYSKLEIQEILQLQEKSTSTVTEFCKTCKIHKATFYNWRNRFAPGSEKKEEFVALQFPDPGLSKKLFAEIEFPSNVRITLFQQVDASYFRKLIV